MFKIILGSFIGCFLCIITVIGCLLFIYDKYKKNKYSKLKGVKPPNFKRKELKKWRLLVI